MYNIDSDLFFALGTEYHYIRRTSDRICKEHGLSIIIPGQDKGKSYIEHQAAQAETSYKAKLKAAIDRLIPASADFEDLLLRLQREGYEIKRGNHNERKTCNYRHRKDAQYAELV